jgi:negative regulator of sigma E activity
MTIAQCAVLLLLVMAHAVGAAAQAPVGDWRVWALRMDKAQRSLNYDATMVIDAGVSERP